MKHITPIKDIVDVFNDRKGTRSAAQCSYFLTLSFFPFLICISKLIGIMGLSSNPFLDILPGIVPQNAIDILTDYLVYVERMDSNTIFIVGLTFLVTSGSAAFKSIISIMEDIYRTKRYKSIARIVLSFLAAILLPPGLCLCIVILLSGNWFLTLLSDTLHLNLSIFVNWSWFRYIVLFGLLMLMLAFLYRFATPKGKSFSKIKWGLFFSTVALMVVSVFYSQVIDLSTRYSIVYGSLASIIVLMAWLYTCANIVIIGGVINYLFGDKDSTPIIHTKL